MSALRAAVYSTFSNLSIRQNQNKVAIVCETSGIADSFLRMLISLANSVLVFKVTNILDYFAAAPVNTFSFQFQSGAETHDEDYVKQADSHEVEQSVYISQVRHGQERSAATFSSVSLLP